MFLVSFKINSDGQAFWGGTANNGFVSWDTNLAIIGGQTGSDLALYSSGEKVRITTTGNVGIGTTARRGILDVVGDASIIMRGFGLGAVQNSTSGDNDIQLAAEDRIDLFASSYSLTTSGNSVDILSGGRIDLSAKGTLTLDTSQNNAHIVLTPGSGNVGIGSTALGISWMWSTISAPPPTLNWRRHPVMWALAPPPGRPPECPGAATNKALVELNETGGSGDSDGVGVGSSQVQRRPGGHHGQRPERFNYSRNDQT